MNGNSRKYNKLELTWVNKDKVLIWDEKKNEYVWVDSNDLRASETRILIEKKIAGVPDSVFNVKAKRWEKSSKPVCKEEHNLLLKGDNLLSLKSLEDSFSGKIKLIYIDPPFNTGSRINADGETVGYDDGFEHSLWLSMMKDRLTILHRLLRKDGIIFVHIDDQELGYLKVLLDEIFSGNFITLITIKRSATTGHKAINPSPINVTDYIIGYAKDKNYWDYKPQYISRGIDKAYNKFIENIDEPYEKWEFSTLTSALIKEHNVGNIKELKGKFGADIDKEVERFVLKNADKVARFAIPSYEGVGKETRELIDKSKANRNRVYCLRRDKFPDIYLYRGDRILFYKDKIKEINGQSLTGEPLSNLWTDIPFQGIANEGDIVFKKGKKPEKMVSRLIEMATEPNDWVLDSFAGSGTTGAVAHKMGRRWILIELGPHAESHCFKRLSSVVDGSDHTGISKEVNWKGGGGFRYCTLGKSLFKKDESGIVEITYDNGPLTEAICKLEGFKFIGKEFLDKTKLHGVVNEKRYCHVTEDFVTQDYIDSLTKEIKEDETLVVYCLKYTSRLKLPNNMQIKKIPRDVIKRF